MQTVCGPESKEEIWCNVGILTFTPVYHLLFNPSEGESDSLAVRTASVDIVKAWSGTWNRSAR